MEEGGGCDETFAANGVFSLGKSHARHIRTHEKERKKRKGEREREAKEAC